MDGLECSEINLSSLNKEFRVDSEYHQKLYLSDEKYLVSTDARTIDCFVTDGQHGYHEIDETSGIHMLTAKNAKNWFADTVNADLVAKWVDDSNKRSSLQENDLILSTRGSVGYCAIVKKDILPANIDQDVARIKIQDPDFRAEYVLCYLNSRFGQNWMKRNQTGMVQQGLSLQKVREILVPRMGTSFQIMISEYCTAAYDAIVHSRTAYTSANQILCEAIDFDEDGLTNEAVSIKTFSKSFLISSRLDAEYYQPKYDFLFETLSKLHCKPLGGENGLAYLKKSIEPGSEAYQENGIPFIRVSDVSRHEITQPDIYLPRDIVKNPELLFPKKDTILFSKDGSVGIAYKLERDEDIITSGALLHLTVKNTSEILPDYLALVLNSPVVQMQAERDSNGAIIQHWKPSEIESVIIPVLDMEKQREIAEIVQKSFALRHRSKQLLEYAKQAVEMAIEQGEDAALAWLKDKPSASEV